MFSRFRVQGKSMEPNFSDGDFVIASRLAYLFIGPKAEDVVVVRHNGALMLKRIKEMTGSRIHVCGDNERSSRFAVAEDVILGKVLFRIKKNQ